MAGEDRGQGEVETSIREDTMTGEGRGQGEVERPIQEETMTGEGKGWMERNCPTFLNYSQLHSSIQTPVWVFLALACVGWMEEYAPVERTAVAAFSWTNLQWTSFSSWQL